jgi:hypothetical protein
MQKQAAQARASLNLSLGNTIIRSTLVTNNTVPVYTHPDR